MPSLSSSAWKVICLSSFATLESCLAASICALTASGCADISPRFPDDQLLQPGLAEHCHHLRIERCHIQRDEEVGAAVLDLVLQLLGGVERRVVDDSAAGLENSEQAEKVVRRVGQLEPNMTPRVDPKLLETFVLTVRYIVEFSVRDLPAQICYRWIVPPFRAIAV